MYSNPNGADTNPLLSSSDVLHVANAMGGVTAMLSSSDPMERRC
jgi:hypothetical protein